MHPRMRKTGKTKGNMRSVAITGQQHTIMPVKKILQREKRGPSEQFFAIYIQHVDSFDAYRKRKSA